MWYHLYSTEYYLKPNFEKQQKTIHLQDYGPVSYTHLDVYKRQLKNVL